MPSRAHSEALAHALNIAFGMTWEILWALVLGLALSGAVQAVVSKAEMTRLLPDDSPRTITIGSALEQRPGPQPMKPVDRRPRSAYPD